MLRTRQWHSWTSYAIVVIAELGLTVILVLIQPYVTQINYRSPYFIIMLLVGYYFGLYPVVLAFVLGLLCHTYVFIPPRYSFIPAPFDINYLINVTAMAIGLFITGFISILLRNSVMHIERVTADLSEANVALQREIQERKRVEEALERSEARFRTTFEQAGIGMTVVDMNGNVITANPAFAKLTGYDQQEMIGMNVEQYAYPEDLEHGNFLLREMLDGKRDSYQIEKRYITRDGKIFWGRLTASIARNPEPIPPFIIGMIEDITERKLAELREREIETEQLEFYRRTIIAATDGKLIITDQSEIEKLCQTPVTQWEIHVPTDLTEARNKTLEAAISAGIKEDRSWKFATCVGEAVTNAIKHAGGGKASICFIPDGVLFMISDQGPGIPALTIPDVALRKGYSTVGTLGVGYKIMMSLSDRVYLSTGPKGTTVAIEMKRQHEESSTTDAA